MNTLDHKPEQQSKSIFVYSDEMSRFDFGPDHPFMPERATKTYDLCNRYGVLNHPWMSIFEPEFLDEALLTLFHKPSYIDMLKRASRGEVELGMLAHGLGTEDNPLLPGIFEWSLKASGGTRAALQSIIQGDATVVFNPLGGFHHAMPDHAEGFCYINDIVIAIKDALSKSPDTKIAYVDLDAHHGNGVQHAFYSDPSVFFFSIHETGRALYPWSGYETEIGEGDGLGFTVNIPLEPGADDEVYDLVLENALFPLLKAFSPSIIVAQLGADTLVSDPLTHLKLTNNAYQKAVKGILDICPRIMGLGGGGYDLYRTARCWTLAWAIMNRVEPTDEYAGLVGGMMFGPEMEVGSLYDHPYRSKGDIKEKALQEAKRIANHIREEIFPVHGLS